MYANSIAAFFDLVTRGLAAPRAVARIVIDRAPDLRERFLMVGLAAALQGALWALAGLLAPQVAVGLAGMLALAAVQFVNYVITATAAYHIGARLGGKGGPADVATAVAWHGVLVAALTPLQAGAIAGGAGGEISGVGAIMLVCYAGLNVWLLASCIAEAHRFASTGRVAFFTVGLFMALGLLLSLFLGGMSTP
ncbi:hypothetical protein [Rubrimonas cliftonensis]|nr:hypothetical protein [Rubrimonas cliftonensis]